MDTRTPGLQEVREKLRVLAMTPKERHAYDVHMDNIMVQNDVLDTAREEGREEGRAEGRAEVALTMKQQGLDYESISRFTGLSIEEIASL